MKQFTKPKNLNGAELMTELAQVDIVVNQIFDNANGVIEFETDNEILAKSIVDAHNGTITPLEPSVEQKLANVGLNLDDLRSALGL